MALERLCGVYKLTFALYHFVGSQITVDIIPRTISDSPLPQLPQVLSDIVLAVDESAWLSQDDFNAGVKPFIQRFVNQLNIAPLYGSSVALVPFSDTILPGGWMLNSDQQVKTTL
jgi:hypothetical protein